MTTFAPRTRVKICGLTREQDVTAAVQAGADAVGFVLYPKSPRHVSVERAVELARHLPPFVTPVFLLVNEPDVAALVQRVPLPQVLYQFHGDETREQCEQIQRPYIRALRIGPDFTAQDFTDFAASYSNARALLLDTYSAAYGGTGETFDWSVIPQNPPCPLILAGGLNAGNVGHAISTLHPWAVDVSSGVEQAPGIKDPVKIRDFITAVRLADYNP